MRILLGAAVAGAIGSLGAAGAFADEIELRNGRILEGEVLTETDVAVTLRVESGSITFEKRLVAAIRRKSAEVAGAAGPAGPVAAAGSDTLSMEEPPRPAFTGVTPAREDRALLWSPERRVGWRITQSRFEGESATFEEETHFFAEAGAPAAGGAPGTADAPGAPAATAVPAFPGVSAPAREPAAATGTPAMILRLVEEDGPGFVPVSFLYRESSAGHEMSRAGRVVGGRLQVETWIEGVKSVADHPLPAGFRFPAAARALVLREYDRLPGGWKGTTYDPRTGAFVSVALRCRRAERFLWQGEAVDACVLERVRGGVLEEERVAADGRVLTADLNGPALTAVGTTQARLDAMRVSPEAGATDEEKRARTVFVAPEDGFRLFKPGIAWEFLPATGRDAATRVTVKDAAGLVFLSVTAEDAPAGEEPPPAALGAALERRLRAGSAELEKLEDGFGELAGRPAYRLLCDAMVKGDRVRTLAWTFVHRGRVWTLTATCPRSSFDEARPFLQRILDGFEWL